MPRGRPRKFVPSEPTPKASPEAPAETPAAANEEPQAPPVDNVVALPRAERRRRARGKSKPANEPAGQAAERPTLQLVVPPDLAGSIHASQAAIQLAEAELKAATAVLDAAQITRQNTLVNVADKMGFRPSEVQRFDTQDNGAVVVTVFAPKS